VRQRAAMGCKESELIVNSFLVERHTFLGDGLGKDVTVRVMLCMPTQMVKINTGYNHTAKHKVGALPTLSIVCGIEL
jgi:hypothetical protein